MNTRNLFLFSSLVLLTHDAALSQGVDPGAINPQPLTVRPFERRDVRPAPTAPAPASVQPRATRRSQTPSRLPTGSERAHFARGGASQLNAVSTADTPCVAAVIRYEINLAYDLTQEGWNREVIALNRRLDNHLFEDLRLNWDVRAARANLEAKCGRGPSAAENTRASHIVSLVRRILQGRVTQADRDEIRRHADQNLRFDLGDGDILLLAPAEGDSESSPRLLARNDREGSDASGREEQRDAGIAVAARDRSAEAGCDDGMTTLVGLTMHQRMSALESQISLPSGERISGIYEQIDNAVRTIKSKGQARGADLTRIRAYTNALDRAFRSETIDLATARSAIVDGILSALPRNAGYSVEIEGVGGDRLYTRTEFLNTATIVVKKIENNGLEVERRFSLQVPTRNGRALKRQIRLDAQPDVDWVNFRLSDEIVLPLTVEQSGSSRVVAVRRESQNQVRAYARQQLEAENPNFRRYVERCMQQETLAVEAASAQAVSDAEEPVTPEEHSAEGDDSDSAIRADESALRSRVLGLEF